MSVASSNGDCDAAGDVDSDQDGLSDAVDDDDDNDGIPDNRKCHSRRCLDIYITYTDEICVDILIFYPMFPPAAPTIPPSRNISACTVNLISLTKHSLSFYV